MTRKRIKFSQRSSALSPSPLKEFFKRVKEMERKGQDILSLGIGDLTVNTDEKIKEAAVSAIRNNKTHYVPESGSYDLKKVISEKCACLPGEVVVSSGAKTVIAAIFWSLLDKGDEILIPSPYYPPFCEVAKSLGAKIKLVEMINDGFYLTAKNLEKSIKKGKTTPKVLIINSPNNPTGIEYDKAELRKIVSLSKKYGFIIISDECYGNYSKGRGFSLRKFSKDVVVINSVSKTYAMTGFRIGWGIMPEELAKKVTLYLENYVGCPNSIAEQASIMALKGKCVRDFDVQREMIISWLSRLGIKTPKMDSGLYVFADFSPFISRQSKIKNSSDLAEYFLSRGVAVTPGTAFGRYPKHLRVSYCVDPKYLKRALARLEEALINMN